MKQTGRFTIEKWLTLLTTVATLSFAPGIYAAEKLEKVNRYGAIGGSPGQRLV